MRTGGRNPMKVALFGMDARSYKTFEMYLAGPCQGHAVVVDDDDADVDILDADFPTAGELLQARRAKVPDRPIILLSLQPLSIPNTAYVPKPVNAGVLIDTLKRVCRPEVKAPPADVAPHPDSVELPDKALDKAPESPISDASATKVAASSGHRPRKPIESNEGGFTSFLGTVSDVNFDDPQQVVNAKFDPDVYFLSQVREAFKQTCEQGVAMQLHSAWKPILILPESRQIWLDADDKQTRVFAGMEQKRMFNGDLNLTPANDMAIRASRAPEKFQDMDAFLWKLAIWASKGRLPNELNAEQPVYIKHWPNFTRLLITPDALRVVALLAQGPRSPMDIVNALNVRANYAFVVISACWSLGLVAQSTRRIDYMLAPEPPKRDKKQGLLAKILSRLRGESHEGVNA